MVKETPLGAPQNTAGACLCSPTCNCEKGKCICEKKCNCDKEIKVYFCPGCNSSDVRYVFGVGNLLGVIPMQKCMNCGFENFTFPIMVTSKRILARKIARNLVEEDADEVHNKLKKNIVVGDVENVGKKDVEKKRVRQSHKKKVLKKSGKMKKIKKKLVKKKIVRRKKK